jgi:hypothetical protein
MAAASLEVVDKKKNKNPQSGKIVLLPAPLKPVKAIMCVGTCLPCPTAYFGDRARNAFPFLNPYIGFLMAHNLEQMMIANNSVDSDMPERLYPGISTRLISMIQGNLTRDEGATYDCEQVERRALTIKGRPGPHKKFLNALTAHILAGPLVWKPESKSDGSPAPFLPISMALASGWSWSVILEDLDELVERSEAFIDEWSWHGNSLKLTGEELHARRQKRRAKKSSDDETVAADDD